MDERHEFGFLQRTDHDLAERVGGRGEALEEAVQGSSEVLHRDQANALSAPHHEIKNT